MLYKQFLEITDKLNPDFVINFDFWLATLPINYQENITASVVATKLKASYSQAEAMLAFAEKKGILEKYYVASCPNDDCQIPLAVVAKEELVQILLEPQYCEECNEYYQIAADDIYVAYKVILQPDVSETEIAKAIEQRLNQEERMPSNFQQADSLINDKSTLYEVFYNPSESAYEEFNYMRTDLDKDYGKNTTLKGKALEKLILKIFENIRFVKGSDEIRTNTNQFDCTVISPTATTFPSIFNYLAPYFIIECKNEPEKTPGNTYFNKLIGIMEHNESKVGIVFSRRPAAKTCWDIAREHYLTKKYAPKIEILLCMDDNDLQYIIDKKVNLLTYIDFKIMQLTTNSPNSKFEMFD